MSGSHNTVEGTVTLQLPHVPGVEASAGRRAQEAPRPPPSEGSGLGVYDARRCRQGLAALAPAPQKPAKKRLRAARPLPGRGSCLGHTHPPQRCAACANFITFWGTGARVFHYVACACSGRTPPTQTRGGLGASCARRPALASIRGMFGGWTVTVSAVSLCRILAVRHLQEAAADGLGCSCSQPWVQLQLALGAAMSAALGCSCSYPALPPSALQAACWLGLGPVPAPAGGAATAEGDGLAGAWLWGSATGDSFVRQVPWYQVGAGAAGPAGTGLD